MNAIPSSILTDESHPLWRFVALLRIAHHIPGRVRLKLAANADAGLAATVDEAKRFGRAVTATPGIRAVNVNLLARSCVVEYDPKRIPPAAWQDLVAGTRSTAAAALLETIVRAGETAAGG